MEGYGFSTPEGQLAAWERIKKVKGLHPDAPMPGTASYEASPSPEPAPAPEPTPARPSTVYPPNSLAAIRARDEEDTERIFGESNRRERERFKLRRAAEEAAEQVEWNNAQYNRARERRLQALQERSLRAQVEKAEEDAKAAREGRVPGSGAGVPGAAGGAAKGEPPKYWITKDDRIINEPFERGFEKDPRTGELLKDKNGNPIPTFSNIGVSPGLTRSQFAEIEREKRDKLLAHAQLEIKGIDEELKGLAGALDSPGVKERRDYLTKRKEFLSNDVIRSLQPAPMPGATPPETAPKPAPSLTEAQKAAVRKRVEGIYKDAGGKLDDAMAALNKRAGTEFTGEETKVGRQHIMNLSKGKEGGDGVVPEGTPSQEVGKALAGASPAVAKLISRFFDMGMPLDRVNAFRQAARSRLSPSEYQEFTRRIDNAVYNLRRSSQALDAYRFRTDLADMPPSEWR